MGLNTIMALRSLARRICKYNSPVEAECAEGKIVGSELGRFCKIECDDDLHYVWTWHAKCLNEVEVLQKLKDRIDYVPAKHKSTPARPAAPAAPGAFIVSPAAPEDDDEPAPEPATGAPVAPAPVAPAPVAPEPAAPASCVASGTDEVLEPPALWREDLFFVYKFAAKFDTYDAFLKQAEQLGVVHRITLDIWQDINACEAGDAESRRACFKRFVQRTLARRVHAAESELKQLEEQARKARAKLAMWARLFQKEAQ